MNAQKLISRRNFLQAAAVASSAAVLSGARVVAADGPAKLNIKLGLDNFSVRAMNWKAPKLIDYAVSLKTDSLFITDLEAFENFEDSYLQGLRKKAADQGFQIHVGTWSICPTSKAFKNKW